MVDGATPRASIARKSRRGILLSEYFTLVSYLFHSNQKRKGSGNEEETKYVKNVTDRAGRSRTKR